MRGTCIKCGICCKAITLPTWTTARIFHNAVKGSYDSYFVLNYWERINFEEANSINPNIVEDIYTYYRCKAYDETKKCTLYAVRPNLCSGFPWYEGRPILSRLFSKQCGFEVDVLDELKESCESSLESYLNYLRRT